MPKLIDVETIASYFQHLDDPRHTRNRKQLLVDVIVICVLAVLCGCPGATAIHRWAQCQAKWLHQVLTLPNGIPSRDCIRRILLALQPQAFQACFQTWTTTLAAQSSTTESVPSSKPAKRLIAIDGKTCRGSQDAAEHLGPLHLVSAWASEEGLALSQVTTEEKSNEIPAIPLLLKQRSLTDSIVTIDAMGCQKAIVEQIVADGGIAIIAVKNNQPTLYAAIESFFVESVRRDFEDLDYRHQETDETGHGRSDHRAYVLAKIPRDFGPRATWPWIKAIGYTVRRTVHADGRVSREVRYYLSTRYVSGKRFAEAVRGHWSIESMYWVLDVTFREDDQRTRERVLANKLSWLRRFAVSILKRYDEKESIQGKREKCGYSLDYLKQVLGFPEN